ncbi:MAG TPA: multicopper oxidase domain-containing protein [Gemmatimonadaceae bacterium]
MLTDSEARRLRRRDFLGLGAASVAAAWLGGCQRDALSPAEDPLFAKPTGPTSTRNPLRIPTTVSPDGLTLTAAPGTTPVGGAQTSSAWMYNNQFPGPTIVANNGGRATMTFVNGLSQHSITHWHGLIVDHEDDGHPKQAVDPGDSYDYDFTIAQRAGLNWYHPHPHMHTGEQVFFGLAGAFIIRDAEESALGLPSGAYEVPLIIRDASFDSAGNLKYGLKSSGFIGTDPLVNGTRNPYLSVDKAIYRFRVLNGCNARVLRIALSNNAQFLLIGNDGGLLASPTSLSQITISPGERLDLIVDFRTLANGASVMLRCLDAGWNLLEFRGTGAAAGGQSMPAGTLSTITSLSGPAAVTRSFSFEGMTKINGRIYDMARTDFEVPRNQVERWRFTTNGNAPHPVHIHGTSFQVVSRSGGRGQVFPWERGWKDTVLLADRETVDVFVRFERTGLYLIHCHQLAHEDQGMMSNFMVV